MSPIAGWIVWALTLGVGLFAASVYDADFPSIRATRRDTATLAALVVAFLPVNPAALVLVAPFWAIVPDLELRLEARRDPGARRLLAESARTGRSPLDLVREGRERAAMRAESRRFGARAYVLSSVRRGERARGEDGAVAPPIVPDHRSPRLAPRPPSFWGTVFPALDAGERTFPGTPRPGPETRRTNERPDRRG